MIPEFDIAEKCLLLYAVSRSNASRSLCRRAFRKSRHLPDSSDISIDAVLTVLPIGIAPVGYRSQKTVIDRQRLYAAADAVIYQLVFFLVEGAVQFIGVGF